MSHFAAVGPQWEFTEVDVSNNTVTVYGGPCLIRAAIVTTALSAHACPISDGSGGTNIGTFAASAAILDKIEWYDMRCPNGIYVDPNDAATGKFIVIWAPLDQTANASPGPNPK